MGFFKKGRKGYSTFGFKCPRCMEGELYPTTILEFKQPFEMLDRCKECNQNYTPEPGFYYGAMFISYIIMGWFCLFFMGFCILGLGWGVNGSFALLVFISVLMLVWIFRFSRSVWINFNVKYNPQAIEKNKARLAARAVKEQT